MFVTSYDFCPRKSYSRVRKLLSLDSSKNETKNARKKVHRRKDNFTLVIKITFRTRNAPFLVTNDQSNPTMTTSTVVPVPTNSNNAQSDNRTDKKRKASSSASPSLTLEEASDIIAKLKEENEELTMKLAELTKKANVDVDALTETERNESDDDDPSFAFLNDSNEPWAVKYRQLRAYKSKHGDCKVPKSFAGGLGSWVDNQRTAYRYFRAGKKTALTQQRIDALDEIEFFWGSKFPAPYKWEDGLAELEKYSQVMGHANIPLDESNQTPVAYVHLIRWLLSLISSVRSNTWLTLPFSSNTSTISYRSLSTCSIAPFVNPTSYYNLKRSSKWIRRVRKEWTLLLKGKESTLDVEKIRTLKGIGFNRRG